MTLLKVVIQMIIMKIQLIPMTLMTMMLFPVRMVDINTKLVDLDGMKTQVVVLQLVIE